MLAGPSELFCLRLISSSLSFVNTHLSLFKLLSGCVVDQSDPAKNLVCLLSSNCQIRTVSIATMYAARTAARPKLSLSISAAQNTTRPSLSLKSPCAIPRSPLSPVSAASPTSKRFSSLQVPSYAYTNSCSSKSILKKHPAAQTGAPEKRIQFKGTPTVHCVTPIENPDEYYGKHTRISREERRWAVRE